MGDNWICRGRNNEWGTTVSLSLPAHQRNIMDACHLSSCFIILYSRTTILMSPPKQTANLITQESEQSLSIVLRTQPRWGPSGLRSRSCNQISMTQALFPELLLIPWALVFSVRNEPVICMARVTLGKVMKFLNSILPDVKVHNLSPWRLLYQL